MKVAELYSRTSAKGLAWFDGASCLKKIGEDPLMLAFIVNGGKGYNVSKYFETKPTKIVQNNFFRAALFLK